MDVDEDYYSSTQNTLYLVKYWKDKLLERRSCYLRNSTFSFIR